MKNHAYRLKPSQVTIDKNLFVLIENKIAINNGVAWF